MSLLLALNEGAWRQPHRAVLLSPWIDLNLSLPSTDSNESTDYLVRGSVESYARLYVSKNEFRNSFVSPLFASDLSGLCPILIVCFFYFRCLTLCSSIWSSKLEVLSGYVMREWLCTKDFNIPLKPTLISSKSMQTCHTSSSSLVSCKSPGRLSRVPVDTC